MNQQLLTQGLGFPPQHQNQQPGIESQMNPRPISIDEHYLASGKLKNKVALITGGDSGIGRAVALAFAREGANVAISYFNEHDDAAVTKRGVEQAGKKCLTIAGDVGDEQLIDYAATKGAIVSFTRSLSLSLIKQGIRVNGVAPGPIWTPLIVASFNDQHVAEFGQNTPMQRAGQPSEVAPCYVFLASNDSIYMSGQILHINGGVIVNG